MTVSRSEQLVSSDITYCTEDASDLEDWTKFLIFMFIAIVTDCFYAL